MGYGWPSQMGGPMYYANQVSLHRLYDRVCFYHKQHRKYDSNFNQVMHICVSNLTITGPDNGLLPSRHQAIIWTNAGILLIRYLGANFNEILIEIHTFSFKKIHLKMASEKWRPFCLGLNVLIGWIPQLFILASSTRKAKAIYLLSMAE